MKKATCPRHGEQGIGLVCTHIAHAIDSPNPVVGFFWGEEDDLARPDAWCLECEGRLIQAKDEDAQSQWFASAEFKILCECCWDEAKEVCSGSRRTTDNAV